MYTQKQFNLACVLRIKEDLDFVIPKQHPRFSLNMAKQDPPPLSFSPTDTHRFHPKKCRVKAGLSLPLNRALWLLSFLLLHLFLRSVNVNNDLGQYKNKLESISTFRARSHPDVVERQAKKVTISVSHQLHTRTENQCTSLCRNMKKLNYSSYYLLVTCMRTPASFKTYGIKRSIVILCIYINKREFYFMC